MKEKKRYKVSWFLIIPSLVIVLIVPITFLTLQPLHLKIPIQKYKEAEKQPTNLNSRKWMSFSMELAKKINFSPTAASRFYAYIAAIFDETLTTTQDINQANSATKEILLKLAPENSKEIIQFSQSLSITNTPVPKTNEIIQKYSQRLQNDNYQLTKTDALPKGEDIWYPRNNIVDKGIMAGNWQPWILSPDTNLKIPPPPKKNSLLDLLEKEKILYSVNQRSYDDEDSIFFWHGSTGFVKGSAGDNITPAGVWQNILFVETGQSLNEQQYAAAQSKLAQAIADSFIITWQNKYTYWTQRPSMRIPELNLLVGDPPFPGYPSGHSTISYTAATVLSQIIPDKKEIWFSNAEEAKNSRLLAGIHFSADNESGALLGKKIGEIINNDPHSNQPIPSITSTTPLTLIKYSIYKIANFTNNLFQLLSQKNNQFKNISSDISCALSHKYQNTGFKDITTQTNISFFPSSSATNSAELTDQRIIEVFAGGVVSADFNNDQKPDLYFANPQGGQLFLNQGNFNFQDVTQQSGITYLNGTGAVAADYDNDGDQDLVLYGHKTITQLFENDGTAKFVDRTKEVGLPETPSITYGAAFNDYNKDGQLDLYLIHYLDFVEAKKQHISPQLTKSSNILYQNIGKKFQNVTQQTGLSTKHASLAVSFLDYDQDGWDDIFIANDFEPNTLMRNMHNGQFEDQSTNIKTPSKNPNNAMGIAVADFNNDRLLDLYLTNIYEDRKKDPGGNQLFINKGNSFSNEAPHYKNIVGGWSWGTSAIDYDNNGLIDLVFTSGYPFKDLDNKSPLAVISEQMVSPRLYFYQNNGNSFSEKSCAFHLASKNHGRGLVATDLNNDGFQEIIINESGKTPRIYQNITQNNNNYLTIKLIGTESNKDGIGAKVWLNDGKVIKSQQLQTSGSYLSSSYQVLHFGLKNRTHIPELKILWPSGKTTILNNITANQTLTITEE